MRHAVPILFIVVTAGCSVESFNEPRTHYAKGGGADVDVADAGDGSAPPAADGGTGDAGADGGSALDGGGEPLPCTEENLQMVFDERLGPLLTDDHLDSCNACHFDGVDLSVFARETSCESMTCLLEAGWVDLENVEDSLLLSFIHRAVDAGVPADSGITNDTVTAEYEAVQAWLDLNQRCFDSVCAPQELTCSVIDNGSDAGNPDAGLDAGVVATHDAGPCPPQPGNNAPACAHDVVLSKFVETVWFWKGRCSHCHEEGSIVSAPPEWMGDTSADDGAVTTLCTIRANGYMDLTDPSMSLLLRKPLATAWGGVTHGGGDKFINLDDVAYVAFRSFIEYEAACFGSPTVDAGGDGGADAGAASEDAGGATSGDDAGGD